MKQVAQCVQSELGELMTFNCPYRCVNASPVNPVYLYCYLKFKYAETKNLEAPSSVFTARIIKHIGVKMFL